MTVYVREIIQNKDHSIVFGEDVDTLETNTFTNTYWPRDSWKTRVVSITLDVEKARELIELLEEYVEYKGKN